VKYD